MNNLPKNNQKNGINKEKYAYLKAEAEKPYKGFRKFIYFGLGASGAIGAFIFFIQIIAGKNVSDNIPNLLIQIAVISLMIFLFRWENRDNN
ncbi:DUF3493 domain-containing protein [Geminocystis sp. NIES-3709]|uniref:DUF3493 domain-containing protein n=1 Tax=Geminocystis sp. NIES-3709 TaxID=1617448 RepID=UPI0005FC4DFA|nr:DUF3493 domain-containing protein [Geminocystis sp. NIES-3709]BAQ63419.1 hypothetical protein GM3709_184 [Geminocystis sp. NIES-3709]